MRFHQILYGGLTKSREFPPPPHQKKKAINDNFISLLIKAIMIENFGIFFLDLLPVGINIQIELPKFKLSSPMQSLHF